MASKKKKSKQKKIETTAKTNEFSVLEKLEQPKYIVGFFVLLFCLMVFLYQPLVFEGKEPSGSDIVSGIGRMHQLKEFEKETGEKALWNPYMFGGMPRYHRFNPEVWSLDTILNKLDSLVNWNILLFLTGSIGLFLLVKYLGLSSIAGMLSALAFVLMPHFQALIIVGHFSKFRALMWMPFVLLTALLFIQKRNLLSTLLFVFALSIQFRTQHYQIMFYTLMLVLFMGIPPLFRLIKQKYWGEVGKIFGFAVVVVVFTLLVVSQNLLSIKEYTPHSTRGGNAISLQENQEPQKERKGVGFDYATGWSYSLSEFYNLIIPKFHGGTSRETYTGDEVPQLRGRQLPTYWGSLPFTQSYEYMGILVVFLALIGIFFQWHRWEVKALTLLTILSLLMALGKNFSIIYRQFFYYVPYFDKFRVPMMILTLVMFTISLLAAFGVSFLINMDYSKKELRQKLYLLTGIVGFFLVIPLLFGSSFSLSQPGEVQRYGQEVANMLKRIRLEMLKESSLKSLVFFGISVFGIFAVQKKWIRTGFLPLLFLIIVAIDFVWLNSHYIDDKFIDEDVAEQRQYRQNQIDKVLLKDKSLYRVFPVGNIYEDTHWTYYYQSIGGYSPAKLQEIQEIRENNLYESTDGKLPINWNVVDMMNLKYLIAQQKLPSSRLKLVASDESQKLFAYQNLNALPRAFFVNDFRVVKDGEERLRHLNNPGFDPSKIAILEETPEMEIKAPDSSSAQITSFKPDQIDLQVYTDKPALLVLSEIYYPEGWHATLDGSKELKIYKTNHLLRSVVVPAGEYQIQFKFHPKSYYAGVRTSLISLLVLYVLILGLVIRNYGKEIGNYLKKVLPSK